MKILLPYFLFLFSCVHLLHIPTLNIEKENINNTDIISAFNTTNNIKIPTVMWFTLNNQQLLPVSNFIPSTFIKGYRNENKDIFDNTPKLNLKYLRFISAQNKCNILILYGITSQQKNIWNWTSIFNVFIFPLFFTPFIDTVYSYSLDLYVFDVKTGNFLDYINYSTNYYTNYQNIYSSNVFFTPFTNSTMIFISNYLEHFNE